MYICIGETFCIRKVESMYIALFFFIRSWAHSWALGPDLVSAGPKRAQAKLQSGPSWAQAYLKKLYKEERFFVPKGAPTGTFRSDEVRLGPTQKQFIEFCPDCKNYL